MLKRIVALIIKEFYSIWRDKKSRFLILVPPIFQLIIFSQAATMEVRNINLAVLDNSKTEYSRTLIEKFNQSHWFRDVKIVETGNKIEELIKTKKIQMGIQIDENFTRNLKKNMPTQILIVVDGRQTNVAGIASGYATQIISDFENEIKPLNYKSVPRINIESRNWFNPNLKFDWYTVISLVCIITSVVALVLTSLSIARERELGTFDQLKVSPLSSFEIMVGKTFPPLVFSLITTSFMTSVAIYIFKIPFLGSFILFYIATLIFIISILGIGLFISSICRTQQQAILGAFAFQMPAILMSGYVSPIEDMPIFCQYLTLLDPIRFYLVIIKGLFLKEMPINDVMNNVIPLALISILSLSIASWKFRSKSE